MIKKTLFLLLLFVSTALRADVYDELGNLMDPPGEDRTFDLYAWVRGGYDVGRMHFEAHVRFDGTDVYFQDICPTANTGSWVRGSYIDDHTIRIVPQTYFTESTDVGPYTTDLVIWHGSKVGYDHPETQYDHYDLIVGEDEAGNMTLTCADTDDWLSVADVAQQGIYDFSSELRYTALKDAPSTDILDQQPAGRRQRYSFMANVFSPEDNDFWADFGYKADIVWGDDGNVYFSSLTPDYPTNGWIRGDYDATNRTITVQPYQAIEAVQGYDNLYTYIGNYDWATSTYLDTPLRFQVDERGWIYATDDAEEQYPCAMYMQGSLVANMCAINQYLTLMPVPEEPVTEPDDLVLQNYSITYSETLTEGQQARIVTVGISGDDVYVQGLSETIPEAWIHGTITGDQVHFPSRQLLTSDDSNLYLYFQGGHFDQVEEVPCPVADGITLHYDASTGVLTTTPADSYKEADYLLITYAGELYTNVQAMQIFNVTLAPEDDWTPANPAAPQFDVECHMTDENPYITFYIPNVDVNGKYLDTNNLYYRMFLDMDRDDTYTFWATNYLYLGQDVTLMPFGYHDGIDISASGTKRVVYLYPDHDYDYLSIQSVYVHDGQQYESEIVTRNYGPYISPDGISDVTVPSAPVIYNLQGQRVGKMQRGINIVNGKKIMK